MQRPLGGACCAVLFGLFSNGVTDFKDAGAFRASGKIRRLEFKERDKKSVKILILSRKVKWLFTTTARAAARLNITCGFNFEICAEQSNKKHLAASFAYFLHNNTRDEFGQEKAFFKAVTWHKYYTIISGKQGENFLA
ncbi:MAG: hypothetical protein VB035_05885 [Candidatus Fimivivens sp.]|nr:hypothetical protein [Candidatus Fimivivens sp.]